MAGKKISRNKKTSKTTKLSLAEQMENSFNSILTKISAQFRKDIMSIKQQETKLKAQAAKTKTLINTAKTKCAALSAKLKSKATPALKKQLNVAKKNHDQLTKTLTTLTNQLALAKKQLVTLAEKQAKFTFITKQAKTAPKKPLKTSKKTVSKKPSAKKDKTKFVLPITESFEIMSETSMPIKKDEPVEIN